MSEPSPQAGARDMELASTMPVGTPVNAHGSGWER